MSIDFCLCNSYPKERLCQNNIFPSSFLSLQYWEFAPNSIHYLLTLWQRMVASVPFMKSTEPHLLDMYAPEITEAFITSWLESVAIVVRY